MTLTLIFLPLSFLVSLYLEAVAPRIAVPLRSHWYFTVAVLGVDVPGLALNVLPTLSLPATVGLSAVIVPLPMATVGALVTVPDVCPALLPVTVTVMALPRSSVVRVYVRPVAPGIAAPLRLHCRVSVASAGSQVPSFTVST